MMDTRDVATTINIHAWQYPEVKIKVEDYPDKSLLYGNVIVSIGSDIALILRESQAVELQAKLCGVLYGNDKS